MRVVICDENERDLRAMGKRVTSLCRADSVRADVKTCSTPDSLFFYMEDQIQDTDLVILEEAFTGSTDGIETAAKLRGMGYRGDVIFYTAVKKAVFRAFDVTPFHYIVKGETPDSKVDEILRRAISRASARSRKIISLSCAGRRCNIAIDDIIYFETYKRIIRVHYDRDQVFEFYSTMGRLEEQLAGRGIIRVHRAFLISMQHVSAVSGSIITMDNGDQIPLGRTYTKEVKAAFRQFSGI